MINGRLVVRSSRANSPPSRTEFIAVIPPVHISRVLIAAYARAIIISVIIKRLLSEKKKRNGKWEFVSLFVRVGREMGRPGRFAIRSPFYYLFGAGLRAI